MGLGRHEAHHFGTIPRQAGNGSQLGSPYPQDEGLPFPSVRKANDQKTNKPWTAYDTADRNVTVFDEDNIQVGKDSERGLVDWDRTHFLTTYYRI